MATESLIEDEDAAAEATQQVELAQQVNEILTNEPTVLEINGKKIEIKSKTLREVVAIDKKILEWQKKSAEPFDLDLSDSSSVDSDEIYNQIEKRTQGNWEQLAEIVRIVGSDTDDSDSIKVEDVWEMTIPDLNKIVIEYIKRNNVGPLLKNVRGMRSF